MIKAFLQGIKAVRESKGDTLLIHQEVLNPEFWEIISYEAKTDELVSLEETNDRYVTQLLLKLYPILEQRLQEHKRKAKGRGCLKRKKRKYANQIKGVTKKLVSTTSICQS